MSKSTLVAETAVTGCDGSSFQAIPGALPFFTNLTILFNSSILYRRLAI